MLTFLAALVNAVVLLTIYFLYEAYKRFLAPPDILSGPMLAVAAVGPTVDLISMRLLAAGSSESLNVEGAYFEILSDMLGSLGVIAATLKEGADGAPDFVRAVPADVHHQEGILIRPVIARRCGRQHHRPAVQGGAIRDLRCHPIVGLVVMTNYRGRFSIVFTLVNSRPTPWPLIRLSPMLL